MTDFVDRHELVGGFDEEAVDEAVETLRRHGVRNVLVSLCDGSGVSRVKAIAAHRFRDAARNGVTYQSGVLSLDNAGDFVSGTGFDFELAGRCFLMLPDPHSLFLTPWHPGTAVAMADPYFEGGEPVHAAPRHVLRRVLGAVAERKLEASFGWEFEFYTFRRGQDGELTNTSPDMQALHQVRHRQASPVFDALEEALTSAGIPVTDMIHEYGPGQLEVNFEPGRGLHGADRAFLFRYAVKEIVAQLGLVASFMTKPLAGRPASGCHLHHALYDAQGRNVFEDPQDPDGVSQLLREWVRGQLDHAHALTALCTQTLNGYKRYVPNSFAPWNVSWGFENRTTLLRVPLDRGDDTRVENRLGEAATNPYLAAAGTLACGLLGMGRGADSERFVAADAYLEDLPRLPASLEHALDALEADADLRGMLGEPFIRLYSAIKRNEIRRSREAVTDWERGEYLELV